jgi:hypothetical protein
MSIIFFVSAVLVSTQIVYSKVTLMDLRAISFIESQEPNGMVLAEPTMSEAIMNYSPRLKDKVLTSLFFEGFSENALQEKALTFLGNKNPNQDFIKESKTEFLLLNFEDEKVRGIKKFENLSYLDKVFSLNYYGNCPFMVLPAIQGFACGFKEVIVYKHSLNT